MLSFSLYVFGAMRICVGVVLDFDRLFNAACTVLKLAPLGPTVTMGCPVTSLQSAFPLAPPPEPAPAPPELALPAAPAVAAAPLAPEPAALLVPALPLDAVPAPLWLPALLTLPAPPALPSPPTRPACPRRLPAVPADDAPA